MHWNPETSYKLDASRFSKSISKRTDLCFFFKAQTKVSKFLLEYRFWILYFRPCNGILKWRQKSLLSWLELLYKLIFFKPNLLHFPSTCHLLAFCLKRTLRFWISKILSSTSELESWFTKIGKVFSVLRYVRYSNLSFSKTTHLKFLSRSELTVIFYQKFIRCNNQ